jgi:signal transduction histidine kinase
LILELKPVALAGLISEFAEDAAALLEETGARFVVRVCDGGMVRGDPALLRQLLLNLAGNAARVSPRGSVVELEARRSETGWTITLTDEGPGLPEEQLERVFGRFVRFGNAVETGDDRADGHGLGLAICRSIAHLHGGEIRAVNRSDGRSGLRVVVSLPA